MSHILNKTSLTDRNVSFLRGVKKPRNIQIPAFAFDREVSCPFARIGPFHSPPALDYGGRSKEVASCDRNLVENRSAADHGDTGRSLREWKWPIC